MQDSNIPVKFTLVWAQNASAGYIDTVPNASQIGTVPGAASFNDGYVPLNFQPDASGGVPPRGADTNGILKVITQWLQWYQAGGPVTYDSAFQTAIGGYPNGAVVNSATTAGKQWQSTTDSNTTNPDTGGAGWLQVGEAFSTGTRLAFNQASAPTGWTKDTTTLGLNDSLLRIVTGTPGSGGSIAFSTWSNMTSTGGHALAAGENGQHTHGINDGGHNHGVNDPTHDHTLNDPEHEHQYMDSDVNGVPHATGSGTSSYASQVVASTQPAATGITINGAATGIGIESSLTGVTVQSSGAGTAHTHPLNQAVMFTDFIVCVKN